VVIPAGVILAGVILAGVILAGVILAGPCNLCQKYSKKNANAMLFYFYISMHVFLFGNIAAHMYGTKADTALFCCM
jgi:hypothetical protein